MYQDYGVTLKCSKTKMSGFDPQWMHAFRYNAFTLSSMQAGPLVDPSKPLHIHQSLTA